MKGIFVPQRVHEFVRRVELRYKQQEVADWLGTSRQHVCHELPKAGVYIVSLVKALGPEAADAFCAAIHEGLRQYHLGDACCAQPVADRNPGGSRKGHRSS